MGREKEGGNKTGYMATLVAWGWAGGVLKRSLGHLDRSCMLKKLKNDETVTSHPRIAHGQRYPMPCLE